MDTNTCKEIHSCEEILTYLANYYINGCADIKVNGRPCMKSEGLTCKSLNCTQLDNE